MNISDFFQKVKDIGGKKSSNQIVFVISSPRSGSTWLTKVVNGHPEVFGTESRFFGQFCEIWADNETSNSPRITVDKFIDNFSHFYFINEVGVSRSKFRVDIFELFSSELIRYALENTGKKVYFDKITPYLDTSNVVITGIKTYFPNSKIIQLIRDGRDVITSAVFLWLKRSGISKNENRYRKIILNEKDLKIKRFFSDDEIMMWAKHWKQPIQELLPRKDVALTIRYEEMKVNLEECLQNLFQVIKLESSEEIIQNCIENGAFSKLSGGRKIGEESPTSIIRKGIIGDWRNYFTRRDAEVFLEVTGDLLIQLEYEKDTSWVESLPLELSF